MTVPLEQATVTQYPILSVEILNLDRLGECLDNPDQLTRLTRDLMLRIESQLVAQKATIESIRDNILFLSFRNGQSFKDVMVKGFKVGLALAGKTIPIHNVELRLRVGMDILRPTENRAMLAVPERMMAKEGQLVVSYDIYKLTEHQIPYEAIGPVKVQGQLKTFFKVLSGQPAQPKSASPPDYATPPITHTATTVPSPLPEPTPAPMPQRVTTPPVEPVPAPPRVSPPPEPPMAAKAARIVRTFNPPEHPEVIDYQPPAFLATLTAPKPTNISYAQAQSVLEQELSEFVNVPPQGAPQAGRIITLTGPSGCGKSAMVGMALSKLPAERFHWLGGHFYADLADQQFPFSFWLELVQNQLGFPLEGAPIPQAEQYLNTTLATLLGETYTADKLDFFKTLLSINPLEPIQTGIREQLGRMIPNFLTFLTQLAREKPVVIVMEDLQYADAASLELLTLLLQQELLKYPVLILMTYAPDTAFVGQFQQLVSLLPFKEYVLDPLDEPTLIQIAQPPLAVPWVKLPDVLRAQLLEKGSPMFLEEAFRWLLLHGGFSLHAKTGKFSPDKKLKKLTVPESLEEIVQDRLNSLDDVCRNVLQIASILGERFSTEMLANLTPMTDRLEDVMKFLWQNGFIVPDSGNLARFRHPMIWRLTQAGIPEEIRREQHQLVADNLEQARAAGISVNPLMIAMHLAAAHRPEAAMTFLNEGGVWLANVGTITGANLAFRQFQHAMTQVPEANTPDQQLQLLETLAVINLDFYPHYAKSMLLQALQLPSATVLETRTQLKLFLAQAYEKFGNYPMVLATLHSVVEALPPQSHPHERIALGSQETWFLTLQGVYQEALQVYEEDVLPYRSDVGDAVWQDPTLRSSLLRGELARARIGLMQCDLSVLDHIESTLIQCDLHNEVAMGLLFRLMRCYGFLLSGSFESYKRDIQPLLQQIEALPHNAEVMTAWCLVQLVYHAEMGDWENAAMLLPNAGFHAEQAKDFQAWCLCQVMAGQIQLATGQVQEAQKSLEQSVTLAAEYQLSLPALIGWRLLADSEVVLGNTQSAEQICERALEIAEKAKIQNHFERYRLILTQARILLARREFKPAGLLLEKTWPALVKTGYSPLIADTAFEIARLYDTMAQTVSGPQQAKHQQQKAVFLEKAHLIWTDLGKTFQTLAAPPEPVVAQTV